MLTYPCDSIPQIVCPMDEDAIPPNPFCSAPPQSEPPPPLLPLSSITPRYSCPCTLCFILLLDLFVLPSVWRSLFSLWTLWGKGPDVSCIVLYFQADGIIKMIIFILIILHQYVSHY